MHRKKLTPLVLKQRPPHTGRVEIRDTESSLILRISHRGKRSFIVRARVKGQEQPIRFCYPAPPDANNLELARAWANTTTAQCRAGQDPRRLRQQAVEATSESAARAERNTFSAIVTNFLARHASRNRSADETKRIFEFYALPRWKDRQINTITRSEVVALLDEIETKSFKAADGRLYGGPVMADHVLAQIRKLMNWHAARDESYTSPIVKGMARTKPKQRARKRVLTDEEIRALWAVLDDWDEEATAAARKAGPTNETANVFGALVRCLLLSAQRRDEVAAMARAELDGSLWTIPASRHKTGDGAGAKIVPLSRLTLAVVAKVVRVDKCDLVFTTNGKTPYSGFSKGKRELDEAMLTKLRADATERHDEAALARADEVALLLVAARKGDKKAREKLNSEWWTLHDLRRTGKTLMARAGVSAFDSERVLGHAIAGVEGVYDRYDYLEAKRRALEALAGIITQIATAKPADVVPFIRSAGRTT